MAKAKKKNAPKQDSAAPVAESNSKPAADTAPTVAAQPAAAHLAAWAAMTTGIEDYAHWQQQFAGRTGADDPPFRRGRIWA